jgi:hypothetical protein
LPTPPLAHHFPLLSRAPARAHLPPTLLTTYTRHLTLYTHTLLCRRYTRVGVDNGVNGKEVAKRGTTSLAGFIRPLWCASEHASMFWQATGTEDAPQAAGFGCWCLDRGATTQTLVRFRPFLTANLPIDSSQRLPLQPRSLVIQTSSFRSACSPARSPATLINPRPLPASRISHQNLGTLLPGGWCILHRC